MSVTTLEHRPRTVPAAVDTGGPGESQAASEAWWAGKRDEKLRKLRAEGLPTREIAKVLRCSQGSVARRCKKLDVPLSPMVKLHGAAIPTAGWRLGKNVGPEPPAVTEQKIAARASTLAARPSAAPVVLEQFAPVPQAPVVSAPPRIGDNAACRWPMWGARPGDRCNPEYCCKPRAAAFVHTGRTVRTPYCDDHSRLAYPGYPRST